MDSLGLDIAQLMDKCAHGPEYTYTSTVLGTALLLWRNTETKETLIKEGI